MILRSTPSSPFVRKVRIAARLLDLTDRIEEHNADVNDPADTLRKQNPLGKIPALLLDDGTVLYDSRVILEYLDHLAGGDRIIPREPKARFDALRLQALCDGMLDASVLIVHESRYRPPEMRVRSWVERQQDKINRALGALEAAPPVIAATPTVGQIALACALSYGDLRFGGEWRKMHPNLVVWHDTFAARVPAFAATKAIA
jgi:glutathione S-transferase